MINLSEVQKEILILLLAAFGVSVLILFVSYFIWKNYCEPKLQGARHNSEVEDPFSVELNSGREESFALRSGDGTRGENSLSDMPANYHRVLPLYPSLIPPNYNTGQQRVSPWDRTHGPTNPTAPSLGSFYSRSNNSIPSSNNTEVISHISGRTTEFPSNEAEPLPTYQELMNRNSS
uniref:uncharacterized protein LOC100182122 isoform X1 n=1 Tax=Ciona intestinalis TaxID=7719 RepID=UPI000180CE07|nr:uncharacterized protein LOC100182122 isoform X1 [Ciona intestinalis]|eukprot:XP_009862389.1 uncharacterized protein LOC100182122 isoform X1 [Ciona intestinalis]